ncbi:MAG: HD domain-containing protein [Candidatus Falkowbacteria bacterium]
MEIPAFVGQILTRLDAAGHEAYLVGGCVRDLLLGVVPKDWDITTKAKPEEILAVFTEGKYENIFGTVIVPVRDEEENLLAAIEVTTYRSEQGYSDRRRPDEITFETELDKDLERRDFTINAMALKFKSQSKLITEKEVINFGDDDVELVDLFGGRKDLGKRIIRAVGEPSERFREDALRLMRAIRFSCQLGFSIEPKTERAIAKLAGAIKFIANERIRDELIKILDSDRAHEGMQTLHDTKMLQYILPELERGVGETQNKHHTYTVFEHLMLSLKYCPSKDWRVRLAALLHDIGKPQTKKMVDGEATFYNHEYLGAKMTKKIMTRLRFANEDLDKVTNLVRNHMFYYNAGEVTPAAVRRLIVKTGRENLKDLIAVRIGDRLGSGVAKAMPYKLRHLEYMIEKVSNDPVSVKMLNINGTDLMTDLRLEPGPKIGAILDVLLAEVIEEPSLNTREYLLERSQELNKLNVEELRAKAKIEIEAKRDHDDHKLKHTHWV